MKKTIGLFFGGKSGEHEVSLVSATSVLKAIDAEKYDVVQVGITKDGKWYTGDECLEKFKKSDFSGLDEVSVPMLGESFLNIDICFPVLHGPNGEDGTIQGFFETLNIAYVGCGVLASSTAMDKVQCKAIWQAAGLPVVDYYAFNRSAWEKDQKFILEKIEREFGFPCFVKPANMGSSVGVSKAKSLEGLIEAINLATKYDRKILVEPGLNVREIECAVIGNDEPVAMAVGEIIVGAEFYDFNDKYVDGKSSVVIPAEISEIEMSSVREICLKAYKSLDCSGLSRVDCFLDRDTGKIYLNEINTLPGFTSISMYPKMAAHYGLEYPHLIERLLELGFERHADKQRNEVVFESEILSKI